MVPWYHTHWCVMCLLFLFPPLGILCLLFSRAFSLRAKLASLIVVTIFLLLVMRNQSTYHNHLNSLWLSKFNQLKREFKFRSAGHYLYRRELTVPRELLLESLLRLDYEFSMGRIELASIHLKEANRRHDLLFEETLNKYRKLLISLGGDASYSTFHDQIFDFSYYYDLFLKDANLNWDIKDYTIPSLVQVAEVIRNYPEKQKIINELREDFSVLMSSITQSHSANLLLPLVIEWEDLSRLETLITRASLIHMILGNRMDLKFYFFAYASRSKDAEALAKLEILGRKPLDALNDYANQSPFHLKAFMLRGLHFLANGDPFKAKLDFEHVFKLDVNYVGVGQYLSTLNLSKEDRSCLNVYKKAEDLRFFNANFDVAVELFESLLEKEWGAKQRYRDEILFNLGVIFRNNLKLYNRAISTFEEILKIEGSFRHEEARYNLIMCHYYNRNYEAMERVTKKFIKEHSNSERVPRLIMINVVMKLMKVFRKVVDNFLDFSEGLDE